MRRGVRPVAAAAVLLLLSGCELPDLQPFATSTVELQSAVENAGIEIEQNLTQAKLDEQVQKFRGEMALREAVMQALVDYSTALANVTAAGKSGREGATSVANALDSVLTSLSGLSLPQVAVSIFKIGYEQVATVRAAQSLSAAITAADPAVQKIAAILLQDLSSLKEIVESSNQLIVLNLQTDPANKTVLGNWTGTSNQIQAMVTRINAAGRAPTDAETKQLEALKTMLDAVRGDYDRVQAEIAKVEQQRNLQIAMLSEAEQGFRRWAQVHGQLAAAVENGLPVNTDGLLRAALDIREAIKQARAS